MTPPLRCDAVVGASHRRTELAIASLRRRAEEIRVAELAREARRLAALSAGERQAVELVTAGIVSNLLHTPTIRIKGEGERYVGILEQLFGLDEAAV